MATQFQQAVQQAFLWLLSWREDDILFSRSTPERPPKPPQDYARDFPALDQFRLKKLDVSDGTKLGLWVKSPANEAAPVIVVVPGRHGHWAHAGLHNARDKDYDRAYRIGFLQALAKKAPNAGIIAVHMRGYGASRGCDMRMGEEPFARDAARLADYLEREYLPGERLSGRRVIVAGESMGGAMAAMLAEEMSSPARHNPPAALALIASFARLADACVHVLENSPLLRRFALQLPDPAHAPEAYLEEREKLRDLTDDSIRHKLDTARRIGTLDRSTKLYIAHAPADRAIPSDQSAKLERAGAARGLAMTIRELAGEYQRGGQWTDTHTGWNAEKVAQDLLDLYTPDISPLPDDDAPSAPPAPSVNGTYHLNGAASKDQAHGKRW